MLYNKYHLRGLSFLFLSIFVGICIALSLYVVAFAGCPAGYAYNASDCVTLSLDKSENVECYGSGRWCKYTASSDGYYKFYGIITSDNGSYSYLWLHGRLFTDPEANDIGAEELYNKAVHSFTTKANLCKGDTIYLLLECRHGSKTFADVTVTKLTNDKPAYQSATTKTIVSNNKGGKVKITFKPNKGKLKRRTKKVYKNGTYGKLPKPKRKGYTFKGWYTKKHKGKRITKNTKVSKRVLYAHWNKAKKKTKVNLAIPSGIKLIKKRVNWTADKRTVKFYLKWNKVKGAKGYSIRQSKSQTFGSTPYSEIVFKTKKNKIYLDAETAYYYSYNGEGEKWHPFYLFNYTIEVRAYKIVHKKYKYGKYSKLKTYSLHDPDIIN